MTTELEKQFFDTFGIPKIYKTTMNIGDLDVNLKEIQAPTLKELYEIAKYDFTIPIYFSWFKRSKRWSEEYPEITDRILLELFDILRATYNIDFWSIDKSFVMDLRDKQASYTNIIYRTGGDFKRSILSSLNLIVKDKLIGDDKIKHQVQELFKGE